MLVLVGILLVAGWVKNEWQRIAQARKDAKMLLERIDEKKSVLAKLQKKAANLSERAKQNLEELRSLDQKAAELKEAELAAKKKYEDSKVPWYKRYFAPGEVAKEKKNFIAYLTAQSAAIAAQATADQFRANQSEDEGTKLQGDINAVEEELNELQSRHRQLIQDASKMPIQRAITAVQTVLPTALWILFGVIVVPALLKLLMYYLVAPLADKIPPIKILRQNSDFAPAMPRAENSAVSLEIMIDKDQELLVHSDFLQSSSQSALKNTQWFLDAKFPLTSLAARMTMLVRIRPGQEEPTRVVVSSKQDYLAEVGIVDIPEGASMVVQPRSLAGILKMRNHPTLITRHWRLFSVHSWLTLQFRFLVFHGPCKIILKGCRGIRAESPDPTSPRLINQSATLGFSTTLDYSNTRCETFISYFSGKEDLFNDRFAGSNGLFVYEEMPALDRKSGLTGRGLEGVIDGFLKAFGI